MKGYIAKSRFPQLYNYLADDNDKKREFVLLLNLCLQERMVLLGM